MEFLPIKEFEKRQKSIDPGSQLALMSSMMKIKTEVIWNKKRSKVDFQITMVHSLWFEMIAL